MDYEEQITDPNALYEGILKATYGSKWKESSQRALLNILSLAFRIEEELKTRTYTSNVDKTFVVHERGRKRYITSFDVEDRAVRHVLCDDVFAPLIREKIIYDNGASVEGRGISFSRKRFEVHLRKYFMQHKTNEGWILFGDFSKFYDNILHDEAKEQLLELVEYNPFVNWLLNVIFKTFEVDCSELTDEECEALYYGVLNKLDYDPNGPKEKTIKKSIAIGDQLSQQIGIYYPHKIDNYIKIVRGQKYYGRYMDDWYIISPSKEELQDILENVIKMGREIGLHINLSKTRIVKLDSTYKFLQVKYTLTKTGKVIKRINPKRVATMRKRLKKLAIKVNHEEIEYENVENSFRAWMGSFYKLLSNEQRQNLISLYENLFDKKVLVKQGKLYIVSPSCRNSFQNEI